MVRVAAPRCDSIKKAAGADLRHGLQGFDLRQPHAQVWRAKIEPARKPDAESWTARIHRRDDTKPDRPVKPEARRHGGRGGLGEPSTRIHEGIAGWHPH